MRRLPYRVAMTGRYSQFQPVYAGLGITAIPCSTDSKKPLVTNFLKMGLPASRELAAKFTEANALGIVCGAHNCITVLDIDSTDKGWLKEAMARHGQARVIAQTASGKFHAYYRFNNEPRDTTTWKRKGIPIDLLGKGGFVMAVPSILASGEYYFIEGRIDDLASLTPLANVDLRKPELVPRERVATGEKVKQGHRNNWLFDQCMRSAKRCDNFDALIDIARNKNMQCDPQMEDGEVMHTALNAWTYQKQGRNRYDTHGAFMPLHEVAGLMDEPDVLVLLLYLRASQGPQSRFFIPNRLADDWEWTLRRLQAARNRLIELGYIKPVRAANSAGFAATFEWVTG
jgi:hypothetical protein